MKICFITPSTGTIQGGVETTVRQFAKHLSKKHDVTLLTGKSPINPLQKDILDHKYEVLTVPFWPRFTLKNNFLTKVIPRLDPYKTESLSFYYNILLRPKIKDIIKGMDVISTHYRLDSRLFSNLGQKLGVPSVFHILGGAYSKDFFEKDRSILYVATEPTTKNLLESTHNLDIKYVVTPGIPSEVLSRPINESRYSQKKLLFVGRLQRSKGLFELIDIFEKLSKSEDNMSLTVVGDGEILNALKETVKERNLHTKIKFLRSVSNLKVFDLYFESSLLLFSSKQETFGLVPLEAMACGLPVLASDIPSLKVTTGDNALLLPPGDIDLWVDRIKNLLSDKNKMIKTGEKGRKWAEKFTWEIKSEEYEKCLYAAIEKFKDTGGK